jgi:ferredoxin
VEFNPIIVNSPQSRGECTLTYFIQLQNGSLRLAANVDETVLECALRHNISWPNACRNGTCRTCLCKMTTGQVHYCIEWPGLSSDEIKDGYILPCVALPASDIVIMSE